MSTAVPLAPAPADCAVRAAAIEDELRALSDPVKRDFLPRFFKTGPGQYGEGDRFLGVVVPHVRRVGQGPPRRAAGRGRPAAAKPLARVPPLRPAHAGGALPPAPTATPAPPSTPSTCRTPGASTTGTLWTSRLPTSWAATCSTVLVPTSTVWPTAPCCGSSASPWSPPLC